MSDSVAVDHRAINPHQLLLPLPAQLLMLLPLPAQLLLGGAKLLGQEGIVCADPCQKGQPSATLPLLLVAPS